MYGCCFALLIHFLLNLFLEYSMSLLKLKTMASGPIISWQIDGETVEIVTEFILGEAPKSLQMVTAAMKLKDACSLEEKLWQNWHHIKKKETLLCQQWSI